MYLVDGRRLDASDSGFDEALAAAHAAHRRPLCLCKANGVPMYVARFGAAHLIKRMPFTGNQHAPSCPSYELPAEVQDEGTAASAVVEDPETGLTTVRLGFALSHWGSRAADPTPGGPNDSVTSGHPTLDLAGLLRYLWSRAELNRWQPGFAGKRTWAVVRRRLLLAAASSVVRGESLQERLYVPETFAVERGDEIRNRRAARWATAAPRTGGPRRLLLLCGEVKEIAPSRHGCLAVIKHIPDQPFVCDGPLYRRLEARFERVLSLWGADDTLHLMSLATFCLNGAGVPTIEQLSLMAVDEHWIPVRDAFENCLIRQLIRDSRRFIRILSIPPHPSDTHPCIALIDVGDEPGLLHITSGRSGAMDIIEPRSSKAPPDNWVWHVDAGAMPVLPRSRLS
jgi:hypothetical protein